MTEDEKLLAFGRMVFGMITDLLILPVADQAYARRTVTTPDGRGGKHRIDLMVARNGVADVMEEAVKKHFAVKDIRAATGDIKQ